MGSAAPPIEPAPRFAIVGYAARFPGAPDADGFWDVLREGRDAVSDFPSMRARVFEAVQAAKIAPPPLPALQPDSRAGARQKETFEAS